MNANKKDKLLFIFCVEKSKEFANKDKEKEAYFLDQAHQVKEKIEKEEKKNNQKK